MLWGAEVLGAGDAVTFSLSSLSSSFIHVVTKGRICPFMRLLCPFSPLSERSGCFHTLVTWKVLLLSLFFVIFLGYVLIYKFCIYSCIYLLTGLPRWFSDKESICQCRRLRRQEFNQSLGWEDPLEEEMATHSSIFACKIPWTEEPGRPQSIGSQRVGHDLVMAHACTYW